MGRHEADVTVHFIMDALEGMAAYVNYTAVIWIQCP